MHKKRQRNDIDFVGTVVVGNEAKKTQRKNASKTAMQVRLQCNEIHKKCNEMTSHGRQNEETSDEINRQPHDRLGLGF